MFLTNTYPGLSPNATGGAATHTLTVGEMPSHNHPFPQNSNGTYDYYWIGQSDEATDFSWSTGPSYELTTNNSVAPQGGGQAHNNLPPYYALCYIIKHTATSGGGFVILPEKSATGTSVEFTGIPSDAKEITLMLLRVSPSGLDDMKVQLGTSSGYITSGYYSASENAQGTVNPNSTDSFIIMNDIGDISSYSGSMVINKSSDTSYTQLGGFYRADGAGCDTYGDLQSVSGTVDRLRIIFSGTDTFDAGKFGLSYKTSSSGSGGGSSNTTGTIVKNGSYVTGHGTGARTIIATTTWTTLNINGGTGQVAHNITKPSANVFAFNKVSNNSYLEIACYFPIFMTNVMSYSGLKLMSSHDGGTNYYETSGLTGGPFDSWGASGGTHGGTGAHMSDIVSYTWHTSDNTSQSSTWLTKTGECRFYFEVRNWSQPTGFTSYWIDYTNVESVNYPRVGKIIVREIIQ